MYTTNAVEALHRGLRKATKTRGAFPSEEAALKLLFLVIRNVSKKWKSVAGWRAALNHFAILWPERMALAQDYRGGRRRLAPAGANRPLRGFDAGGWMKDENVI